MLTVLTACVVSVSAVSTQTVFESLKQQKIKHVVLLMEENRSFDHMLGFRKGINGLKGTESNPYNTADPHSQQVTVLDNSPYVGPFDPDHSLSATTDKIFGLAGVHSGSMVPLMDGFIEYEKSIHNHNDPTSVMNMFTPDRLPVMNALADEFAVFDRFFCSVPGPTWPNRLFQLLATSEGDTATSAWDPQTGLYTSKSIFHLVEEAGLDWKFYFADAPLEMAMIEKILLSPEKVHDWSRFKKDIRDGHLPAFSWVNPRWFVNLTTQEGASDQHPDHDVRLGEALMKEVYEMLRASPTWNETLFIITYDEHGGFYDHVPPPMNIPAPDKHPSFPDKGFGFDRLGVRIPVLLISPWVAKGTVISAPTNGPFNNSEYDATSIIATVGKLFNFTSSLTKRDAWAATFEQYISEETPRTDCPLTLPAAPKSLGALHATEEGRQALNDLQKDIVKSFAALGGPDCDLCQEQALPLLQGEGSVWIEQVVKRLMEGKHVLQTRSEL